MAVQVDAIRAMAERVAASHHLEVVDAEFVGGGKARTLRIYVEKDAAERAALKERLKAQAARSEQGSSHPSEARMGHPDDSSFPVLPKGVPVELLSGVTHEDCAEFARDFGTLLDVEDAVPGSEYTLEVSSPGLERSLKRAEEYERFAGSLVKVKTFVPVNGNKVWTGRLTGFADGRVKLDLAAAKQKGKARKAAVASEVMEIALRDIEKANLVAEI
jgi:ribosome maturation factor RimP